MAVADRNVRGVLARTTTGEQVADDLRAQIFSGALPPGEPLREAGLAADYETSRRTVQDALAVLATEGLVRHERHRGAKVAQLARGDVEDLYRVRLALESAAAKAVGAASSTARQLLTDALEHLRDATNSGDPYRIVECDLNFHRAVVGLLESPRVDAFFASIAMEMRFALTMLESVAQEANDRPDEAFAEHRAIHDALLKHDVQRAESLIYEHVAVYRDRLCRIVDEASAS
jgi:DNA-binding GntR family transcriptional regulator